MGSSNANEVPNDFIALLKHPSSCKWTVYLMASGNLQPFSKILIKTVTFPKSWRHKTICFKVIKYEIFNKISIVDLFHYTCTPSNCYFLYSYCFNWYVKRFTFMDEFFIFTDIAQADVQSVACDRFTYDVFISRRTIWASEWNQYIFNMNKSNQNQKKKRKDVYLGNSTYLDRHTVNPPNPWPWIFTILFELSL